MAGSIPPGARAIGRNFYLFKSSQNSKDCVISAHGGFISGNSTFTVPQGVTIDFYGPHGAAMIDPNIDDYMRKSGDAMPVERATAGSQCRNYYLSKYQGAHAGQSGKEVVETYDDLHARVTITDRALASHANTVMQASQVGAANPERAAIAKSQIERIRGGNILTIRNRWNILLGVTLKDAIDEARKAFPAMTDFHCLFCRSYMLGGDGPSVEVGYR